MQHTVRGGGYLAPTEKQPCYFDSKVKELWEKLPQIALARSILRPRVARAPDVAGRSKPARFRSGFGAASISKRRSPRPSAHESPSGWRRTGCLWPPLRLRECGESRPPEVLVRRSPRPVRGRCCAGRGGASRGGVACPCGARCLGEPFESLPESYRLPVRGRGDRAFRR